MNKKFTVSSTVTLMLGLITFLWLLFYMYHLWTAPLGLLRFGRTELDSIELTGYLAMLLFHASALLFIFMKARYTNRFGDFSILALLLGIVSLFAIAVEKVMADEIGREMAVADMYPGGEIFILYASLGINMLFSMVMMVEVFRTRPVASVAGDAPVPKDDRVFTLVNAMGVVSGVLGLLLTFSVIGRPSGRFLVFIPFYLLFLTPYCLGALFWVIMKWRDRPAGWYDEKQIHDILKASLTTLLLSLPGLTILALFRRPIVFYWFPIYLFLTLSLFSVSTLYYFKRE